MMRGTSFLRGGNFKYIFEFIFSEELEVNGGQFILSSLQPSLVLSSVFLTPRRSFRISDAHSRLSRSSFDPTPRPWPNKINCQVYA